MALMRIFIAPSRAPFVCFGLGNTVWYDNHSAWPSQLSAGDGMLGWIKWVQEGVPWLRDLRRLPKGIISTLILGTAAFCLVLIWTSSLDMPVVVQWLAKLPPLPKGIVSTLIVGAAAFVLVLIWTTPPEVVVKTILADCYRRALFTRTHAQMDRDAMFVSIGKCREVLQERIPYIQPCPEGACRMVRWRLLWM